MGLPLLKFTQYTENFLCIYRNFCLFGKITKSLIVLRITLELLLIAVHSVVRIRFYPHGKSDVVYYYLTSGNSVFLIICALYQSKKYKSLTTHLESGLKFFNEDEDYLRNVQGKHTVFVGFLFALIVLTVITFGYIQLFLKTVPILPAFWHCLFQTNLLICDFRYNFEYLTLYCVLYLMSEQLKFVARAVNTNGLMFNGQQLTEVDKWSAVYKHIRESSELFNSIFGVQLTVMIATAIFYYIIFLYTITSQSVAGHFTILDSCVYLAILLLLLFILHMLSLAAQRMQNSADALRRRLCKLLIYSLTNGENYKVTKDLLRLISTQPIRARAFGSINVDMTLLPTCVSFFTSYTVIALQFNNVL